MMLKNTQKSYRCHLVCFLLCQMVKPAACCVAITGCFSSEVTKPIQEKQVIYYCFYFQSEHRCILFPSPRCAGVPQCNIPPWRRCSGVWRSLLSTQPNQKPSQSDLWTLWSTGASWPWRPRHSEALCNADGLYWWPTTAEVETHSNCGQSWRWEGWSKAGIHLS